MKRTLEEVNQHYLNECAKLGHKAHLLERLPKEIEAHRRTLSELNLEADSINAQTKSAGETNAQEKVASLSSAPSSI